MAKYDRCIICDYSESNGSPSAGINPGRNGKVRLHDNDMVCDVCTSSIGENLVDLVIGEEDK